MDKPGAPHDISALALAVTAVMFVRRIRGLFFAGRRQRWRARQRCRCLHPMCTEALARPEPARLPRALELALFPRTQYMGLRGLGPPKMPNSSYLYQLGSEVLYIGKGSITRAHGQASGGIGRFREHVRGLFQVQKGQP
eukprot:8486756-Pyramimonas_sp.AAC.1